MSISGFDTLQTILNELLIILSWYSCVVEVYQHYFLLNNNLSIFILLRYKYFLTSQVID